MYCSSQKQDVEKGGMAYNDDLFNEMEGIFQR